jgi:geranylgeranyl pyrophosphate synthase
VAASRVSGTATNESQSAWNLPELLGLTAHVEELRAFFAEWIEECDPEVREMVRRQLSGRAKYFRPVTLFACHAAATNDEPHAGLLRTAAAVELIHNVSLIVDDILDRSRYRRGLLALHCRYGFLPALMTAGYMGFAAPRLVASDAYAVRLITELMQRLGVAECLQWRVRRQPLGVEDWRALAGEDTGSMFEICAGLGTRDDRLRKFGRLLGMLYHGCDDVADVRGTTALGGGSEADILEGILTLPAAIAIRDPEVAALFRTAGRNTYADIADHQRAALPEAEAYLDSLLAEAEAEAIANALHPGRLLELARHTRALSSA